MNDQSPETSCTYHPDRLTALRCNRCDKPICSKCAILTPTGYRCKECIRSQQRIFDTTLWYDYFTASIIAAPLSFLGSLIIPALGFFGLLLAAIAGGFIAEIVRFATSRRRSKLLYRVAAVSVAIGALPLLILNLLPLLAISNGGFGLLWSVAIKGGYALIVTMTVYYRLSGIRIRV